MTIEIKIFVALASETEGPIQMVSGALSKTLRKRVEFIF